ncbi:hypothetical protein GCM10010201_03100 [Pilimelia columellifera subsp. columellifera]|uniref:O-antigen ligase-related domain-containing protein n=1 Tax=Pilimelia columellifera subsp. columellifera TaxID=706583 RepID=A0ABN3N0C9_9ACTN
MTVLVGGLFAVTLAGRFSFAAESMSELGLDPRVPLVSLLLCLALLAWGAQPPPRPAPQLTLGALMLLGYLLISSLWAHPAARVAEVGLDLVLLAGLITTAVLVAALDPQRVMRLFFQLSLVAAGIFALAAMVSTSDQQGRYAAFGGGPNVFVRIQCLGIIAAFALYAWRRRWVYLLPVPLLLHAAVASGSRGGLAALVAAVALAIVLAGRLRTAHTVGVLVTGGGFALFVYAFGNNLNEQVYRRFSLSQLQDTDFSTRPELLRHAWVVFTEHKTAGAGLDGFFAHIGQYIGITYPHNLVAQVAADGGLIGLALLAAAAVGPLWRSRHASWQRWDTCGALVSAAYIATASMFSGSYYDARQGWIYLAFLAALAARAGAQTDVAAGAGPGTLPAASVRTTPRTRRLTAPDRSRRRPVTSGRGGPG